MSILVKEDYVNPEIPLWASASGGGGGGPLIVLPTQSGSVSGGYLAFGANYTMYYINIPTEIAVGDDFVFQCVMILDDYDSEVSPFTGNYSYIATYTDADKNWAVASSTSAFNDGTGYASTPDVTLTLMGHRGESASPINIIFINRIMSTGFSVNGATISNITFTKVGSGLVISP